MKYELIVAAEAKEQLWETANWYCERSGSIDVGLAWHNGFIEALDSLTEDPLRFALAPENDKFPYDLRQLLYGSGRHKSHRALFRVEGNRIEVLAIRHHAQGNVARHDL